MNLKLELTFPGTLKDEPIICELCKKFEVILNIIEASFSTDTGWAILILKGEKEELNRAVHYLRNKGITLDSVSELG